MKHLRKTNASLLALLTLLLSACGRVSSLRNFAATITPGDINITTPITQTPRPQDPPGISAGQLIASPGLSANTNSSITVSLVNSLNQSPLLGAFSFEGSVPAGVSFVGSTSGVSSVQVTSSVATSINVLAVPAVGTTTSQSRITLTFTAPSETVFECSVVGPQPAYVNQFAYFSVSANATYGQLLFEQVGTGVASEQAYNAGLNRFAIKFLTSGTRSLELKARSSSFPNAYCHKQISVTVIPQPITTPPSGCGIYYYQQYEGTVCNFMAQQGYYFNGTACVMGWNTCTQRLPFSTLDQCQAALQAGRCPGYVPPPPPLPAFRWVQTDGQSCSSVCSSVGLRNISDANGNFCTSGEARSNYASGIYYSHGIWGSGNAVSATSQGKYCYQPNQKHDHDKTDITVGCFCGQ